MNNERYIENIRDSILSTYDEKKKDRIRAKSQVHSQEQIDNQPFQVQWPFFCLKCSLDFMGIGFKVTSEFEGKTLAWYKTFHRCGQECIRRITNRIYDEFYNLSEDLKIERQKYEDDMLSPYQNRFVVLYGRQDEQREKEYLQLEEALFKRKMAYKEL